MSTLHPNIVTLRAVYADLRCIGQYSDDQIVLHTADRGASGGPAEVTGKEAVRAKELDLIRLSGDTLVMDVQNIIANDYFGAVLGTLRTRRDDHAIGMPFCGLWRFRNGLIVEHWENAYEAAMLGRFLMGEEMETNDWVHTSRPASGATHE
ncbi:SnoaL-like protein [Luteibacter rhizovicinus]|uniref:SnoaL-like protein n=1 Tax=Luteibacter rhizovicinus TaxID=242606 RepID=A0A4R3YLP0_9GAMM|nr:nuclear transport factor 2 family protein [Luteibacter rhizovicinus]TCV92378.1 SnoaL-like protein [Luteibacter rhizovicinus]